MKLKKIVGLCALSCLLMSSHPAVWAMNGTNVSNAISVLPQQTRNAAISTPEQSLGFALGEWHARPEQLHTYYQLLASQSKRVSLRVTGYTHERRPILNLIITSEKIRRALPRLKQHVSLVKLMACCS